MKKSVGLVFGCTLLAALLTGCGSKQTVVGTWDISTAGKAVGQDGTLTFEGDKVSTVNELDLAGKKLKMSMAGTYKLEKDVLTLTYTTVSAKSPDPQVQSMIDAGMAASKDAGLKQAGEAMSGKMTWKSNDEFELKVATGTLTCKRKK
ncbi:MAG: hypothetical protein K8R88_00385 [Armatimonadetes bacterium]|nr:hypothetical protein [Armatimonadota bacterium]